MQQKLHINDAVLRYVIAKCKKLGEDELRNLRETLQINYKSAVFGDVVWMTSNNEPDPNEADLQVIRRFIERLQIKRPHAGRSKRMGGFMRHSFSDEFDSKVDSVVRGPDTTRVDLRRYSRVQKRLLDLVICAVLVPLLLPVILVLAIFVRRDGGPAFFSHERIGRNGVPFKCWKLRSMVPDAKARLDKLLKQDPQAAAKWKLERKLDDDPRITRLGAVLRKCSLDELPQLWNVIRGEMSLVGPRPVPRDELDEKYGDYKWIYQTMRPGVTGSWQVSGRNDVSYDQRVQMDIAYCNKMSLGLDLMIIARTASAVLNRTGK